MERSTATRDHWSYQLRRSRLWGLRLLALLPGPVRLRAAESLCRRPDQPGPAPEHVLQYLVSDTLSRRRRDAAAPHEPPSVESPGRTSRPKAVTVGQADFFYRSQYRQFCSPVMAAFASTAVQVLAATGAAQRGHLWAARRPAVSAMLPADPGDGLRPLLVVDEGTVAVAVLLPRASEGSDDLDAWVTQGARMPRRLASLVDGNRIPSESGVARSTERTHVGSVCELVDAALRNRFLALLALHPFDPDAMGLHLTLFGVEGVRPDRLATDYGLDAAELEPHHAAAARHNAALYFLVGGTAEVFTQCSQNLFTKRPLTLDADPDPETGESRPALGDLLAQQFETLQVTVAADGVPGASPRNGQIGRAAFLGHRRGRAYVLIPYHPGNAIHGHAAKLWSNPSGSIVVSDDHTALRRATVSGHSTFLSHPAVARRFPDIARTVTHPDCDEQTVDDPVYWFVTRADHVVWESGTLAPTELTPERPVCGIHAGGEGRHTKKPKYFDAASVDAYDMQLQHLREVGSRRVDPTGERHAEWLASTKAAVEAREAHLSDLATG